MDIDKDVADELLRHLGFSYNTEKDYWFKEGVVTHLEQVDYIVLYARLSDGQLNFWTLPQNPKDVVNNIGEVYVVHTHLADNDFNLYDVDLDQRNIKIQTGDRLPVEVNLMREPTEEEHEKGMQNIRGRMGKKSEEAKEEAPEEKEEKEPAQPEQPSAPPSSSTTKPEEAESAEPGIESDMSTGMLHEPLGPGKACILGYNSEEGYLIYVINRNGERVEFKKAILKEEK